MAQSLGTCPGRAECGGNTRVAPDQWRIGTAHGWLCVGLLQPTADEGFVICILIGEDALEKSLLPWDHNDHDEADRRKQRDQQPKVIQPAGQDEQELDLKSRGERGHRESGAKLWSPGVEAAVL